MNTRNKTKKRLFLAGTLFLMLFLGLAAQADASWIENADGTYSYQKPNGEIAKKTWIKKVFYVDAAGIRVTGMQKIGRKWYYFSPKSGKLKKDRWVRIEGKYYYFDEDGVMQTKRWLEDYTYYVGKEGFRATKRWIDGRYLNKKGVACSGLRKIDGKYYYFDLKTHKKVTNSTLTVKGKRWQFDETGVGRKSSIQAPSAGVSVQPEYYTHPAMSDEKLLSYLIYCEAGNQPYEGKVAIGMVVLNRVYSRKFRASTVREVIYEKNQFNPTWNGAMARVIKKPSLVNAECKKAAKYVLKHRARFAAGKTIRLKLNGKKISFPYFYYMSQGSYYSFGLSVACTRIGDHVFFKSWY